MESGFGIERPTIMPPFSRNVPTKPKLEEDEFDVDELIKKIDAKIAELEKEDAENSKKLNGKSNEVSFENLNNESLDKIVNNIKDINQDKKPTYNNDDLRKIVEPSKDNAVKVSADIDKIIEKIEDEDVSDDEFFDDFFFDE